MAVDGMDGFFYSRLDCMKSDERGMVSVKLLSTGDSLITCDIPSSFLLLRTVQTSYSTVQSGFRNLVQLCGGQ